MSFFWKSSKPRRKLTEGDEIFDESESNPGGARSPASTTSAPPRRSSATGQRTPPNRAASASPRDGGRQASQARRPRTADARAAPSRTQTTPPSQQRRGADKGAAPPAQKQPSARSKTPTARSATSPVNQQQRRATTPPPRNQTAKGLGQTSQTTRGGAHHQSAKTAGTGTGTQSYRSEYPPKSLNPPALDEVTKKNDLESTPAEEEPEVAEWAQKPSRARRFTAFTRPDFHQRTPMEVRTIEDLERDEELEKMNDQLGEMEEYIADMQERRNLLAQQVYDDDGNPIQQYDDEGNPIPMYDKDGFLYEEGAKKNKKKPNTVHISLDPNKLILQGGWMYKKGKKPNTDNLLDALSRRNWKRRYFHLDAAALKLYYFKSQTSKKPLGYISLYPSTISRATHERGYRVHQDANIHDEFVFFIETADRTYELYAETEDDMEGWIKTIEYILDSVEKAKSAGQQKSDKKKHVDDDKLVDDAQCHSAFGTGLFEGHAGQPMEFTIQAAEDVGSIQYDPHNFSAVLESQDLHYDLPLRDNGDGTMAVIHVPTRIGTYELSILYNGYDIYGSPFYPTVHPAPMSSPHCVAQGPGLHMAVVGSVNEFVVQARNSFDHVVRKAADEEIQFQISGGEITITLVDNSPVHNGDGTYTVRYTVQPSERIQQSLEDGMPLHLTLDVLIDDGLRQPSFFRHIRNSPFDVRLLSASNTQAVAQARDEMKRQEAFVAYSASSSDSESRLRERILNAQMREHQQPANGQTPRSDPPAAAPQQQNAPAPRPPASSPAPPSHHPHAESPQQIPAQHHHQQQQQFAPQPQQQQYAQSHPQQQAYSQGANPSQPSPYASSYLPVFTPPTHQSASFSAPTLQHHAPADIPTSHGNTTIPLASPASAVSTGRGLFAEHVAGKGHDWVPHASESDMVKETLEERALAIERERDALMRIRCELDEGRGLVDQQVSQMQAMGRRVQEDSERLMTKARSLFEKEAYEGQVPTNIATFMEPTPPPTLNQGGKSAVVSNGGRGSAFDRTVTSMFEKHRNVLESVYRFYADRTGIDLQLFLQLAFDYDILPTFISRRELREAFDAATRNHSLDYHDFLEALGHTAVIALSKPMFAHLYTTTAAKVNVLLTMWGVADRQKLHEIDDQTR